MFTNRLFAAAFMTSIIALPCVSHGQSEVKEISDPLPLEDEDPTPLLNALQQAMCQGSVVAFDQYDPTLIQLIGAQPETALGLRARELYSRSLSLRSRHGDALAVSDAALQLPVVQSDDFLLERWRRVASFDAVALYEAAPTQESALPALDRLNTYVGGVQPTVSSGPLRMGASSSMYLGAMDRKAQMECVLQRFEDARATGSMAENVLTSSLVPAGMVTQDQVVNVLVLRIGTLVGACDVQQALQKFTAAGAYLDSNQAGLSQSISPWNRAQVAINALDKAGQASIDCRARFAIAAMQNRGSESLENETWLSIAARYAEDCVDADIPVGIAILNDLLDTNSAATIDARDSQIAQDLGTSNTNSYDQHRTRFRLMLALWKLQSRSGETNSAQVTRTSIVGQFADNPSLLTSVGLNP